MFIPFYVPGTERLRVVVVGGGYAGLAALITLREQRRDAELVLIDRSPHHLKITRLHESFRRPWSDLRVPFRALEQRFGFRHLQAELELDEARLKQWNADRVLPVADQWLDFDYLLIAVGAGFRKPEKGPRTFDLDDFAVDAGPDLLEEPLSRLGAGEPCLTVVGAGASGIQFLFEIAHYLREQQLTCRLRLVDGHPRPLPQFRAELGRYVLARLAELDIEFLPNRLFRGQEGGQLILEDQDGVRHTLPSDLSLLFLGKAPALRLETNWFGQVIAGGEVLERVFAAGDCSRYRSPGSNALSAQTALRKGKLAARNILRHSGPLKWLEPHLYQELGYVIGLGPRDAVGWLALERNVVGGLPASVVKELVEAQYDLLLAGVDTYLL
ncbi:NAD(P)/FAD-dependent oxidoreductase [Candidatus Methylocalor cossyra]|uniref:NADH dehydrogenase n=1 Tax=Candidatus Methylocalor cossyra TaxID=3108543 RepID=A0ABM9NFA4_9GAMM